MLNIIIQTGTSSSMVRFERNFSVHLKKKFKLSIIRSSLGPAQANFYT